MTVIFYSRANLGMLTPRGVSYNVTPRNGGVAVHYGGVRQGINTEDQAKERWLQWQRFHMQNRKWNDIAYTAGFDNWGNVYAGRGLGVRTAANGTNAGNQNYYAFCWIGGGDDPVSPEAYEALNWLIENARKDGAGVEVKPHSHFRQTGCPGNELRQYAVTIDGRVRLPEVEADAPAPVQDLDALIRRGDRGPAVRNWQLQLRKWNSNALPRFGPDGDFGNETADWTGRFMVRAKLVSSKPENPIVGARTRAAMDRALNAFSFRYSTTIRNGSEGDAVREWQRALKRWNGSALPRFGADGDFGSETTDWTRRFQRDANITIDGVVGPQSRGAMLRRLA